jgi:hypothetical protein
MSENPSFQPYDNFLAQLALGKNSAISMQNDIICVGLTNTTPNLAHTKRGDLVDIGAGNGYPGPTALTITSRSISGNKWLLVGNDIIWEPTGAGFGPFRHIYVFSQSSNTTASEQLLMGYWSFAASQTVTVPYPFKIDFSLINGALGLSI